MTTSSLILNALVCLAIAAVRARSSQNFLRASGDTATKPSAPRAFAMRTTSDAAFATASSSLADDVAEQHHLRPPVALRLGGVADRLHVALVEVLEAREDRAVRARVEVALDLDDGGRRRRAPGRRTRGTRCGCAGGMRCRMKRALVMMPSQPSFCTPGRPARNLSVTSLPRPTLRNSPPPIFSVSVRSTVVASFASQRSSKRRLGDVVDLAEVVVEALDLEPARVGRHHAPRREVVERRAPQHRLLAAGVHGDVAADARRVGRRRVAREHEARGFGRLHHALRDHAGAAVDRRAWAPRDPAARCARPP